MSARSIDTDVPDPNRWPPGDVYDHDDLEHQAKPAQTSPPKREAPQPKPRIPFRHVADIVDERRQPTWLLRQVLEAGVLAVLVGPRGTFKSFLALHWAMTAAVAERSIIILSAEGAGLDRRVDAWMRVHAPESELRSLSVLAVERQLNLNSAETLRDLTESIRAADAKPDLIVVDTFSKFAAGLDENDNAAVALFLAMLSGSLRDEFGATVLLVAHTGHADAKRPRGASVLMANPDAEYIVERPDPQGMTVTVSRERFKDSEAMPALAYTARVVDLDRADGDGQPVTSLVLVGSDAPAPAKAKAAGANQQAALVALREWARANADAPAIPSIDLKNLLQRQGVGAKRRPEVINWLVNAGVLTASIGGHTVNREAL